VQAVVAALILRLEPGITAAVMVALDSSIQPAVAVAERLCSVIRFPLQAVPQEMD
jgi:hypothetical protein